MKSANKKAKRKEVPCCGCTLCCKKDAIMLYPEDKVSDYFTEPHPYIPGALMLAHKPDGECIYLSETGCTIHDRAPSLCRIADCRNLAIRLDFESARKLHQLGNINLSVWDKGNTLLNRKCPIEVKQV